MATNFRFNNGGTITDFSDVFIRRDIFLTGGLWAWGTGSVGYLGDGTTADKSSPVQTVAGGTNWKQVSVTGGGAAIKTDGTLWTWGYNQLGGLGDNTSAHKSSPVQTVAGGTNWKQVSSGSGFKAAIKTDGTLWTWGNNNKGQLGDNTGGSGSEKSSPVQTVAGGTNWNQVSCGYDHTGAIKTDGTLWMWGGNSFGGTNFGELGDNTIVDKSSPVQTVAGGTNWKQVSVGSWRTAAIKTDGTLWMWGYNPYGELGDNTRTSRSSPVQTVAGGTNWKQICAESAASAIKTDGTLWTWGTNGSGTLGDGTTTSRSSPVQTVAGGTNWKQVSSNGSITAAIKTNGTLWTWGYGYYGMLGNGTSGAGINVSSPVQTLTGGTNWKQVDVDSQTAMAISEVFGDGYGLVTTLVEIYASGTWTVPSGVTSLNLVCVGAGGNGGSVTKTTAAEYSAGGGGGAGEVNSINYSVSAGQVLTITIGQANGGIGGIGGTTTVTGGSGGTFFAEGGLHGTNGTNSASGDGGTSGNSFPGANADGIDTGGGGGGSTATPSPGGSPGAGTTITIGGTSFYLADGGGGLGIFGGNTTIGGGGNGASRLAVGTTAGQNGVSGAVIFSYVI